jgi:hypothetical protein
MSTSFAVPSQSYNYNVLYRGHVLTVSSFIRCHLARCSPSSQQREHSLRSFVSLVFFIEILSSTNANLPRNPLKRKTPSEGFEPEHQSSPSPCPSNNTEVKSPPKEEYQTGRVICEICGTGVSFRDERTGGFTLKQWNEHRLTWYLLRPRCRLL